MVNLLVYMHHNRELFYWRRILADMWAGVRKSAVFKSGTNTVLSTITNWSPSHKLLKSFLQWPCVEGCHLPMRSWMKLINTRMVSLAAAKYLITFSYLMVWYKDFNLGKISLRNLYTKYQKEYKWQIKCTYSLNTRSIPMWCCERFFYFEIP